MFSVYAQSGTHSHFNWRIIVVLTYNPSVPMCVEISGDLFSQPTSADYTSFPLHFAMFEYVSEFLTGWNWSSLYTYTYIYIHIYMLCQPSYTISTSMIQLSYMTGSLWMSSAKDRASMDYTWTCEWKWQNASWVFKIIQLQFYKFNSL